MTIISLYAFKFFICCQIKTNLIAFTIGENIPNNVKIFAINLYAQGTNHIWYLTVILLHNNLFVPPLTLYLDLWTTSPKCHFPKWNKIYLNCAFYLANHLSVHTIWQIWIQDPAHNLYHWALPHIKDSVDGYLISIPTRHNLSTSLRFS